LTETEQRQIKEHPYVWGCDICQDVCPKNINVEHTNIPGFKENLVENLDAKVLYEIADSPRSFFLRGIKILERNLKLKE
jgi:epoxyqueuosine reductase QueG